MDLTPDQIDALKELINIGIGRSASMLNEMVNTRVYLQVPSVKVFSPKDAKKRDSTDVELLLSSFTSKGLSPEPRRWPFPLKAPPS